MCDEWMPVVDIPMSLEQYHQLPRHPAYKYEYLHGRALLTPRPKFYHARLVLSRFAPAVELLEGTALKLQPVRDDDFADLKSVFSGAFHGHQPFASVDENTLHQAADQCLEKTRAGNDGPWLREASFVARVPTDPIPLGAIFVTLIPEGDSGDADSFYWRNPAPEDMLSKRGGRPHLTWIFVRPTVAKEGTGTALLQETVAALLRLGYPELVSTFLVGNHSTMLWHWRNGFELLSDPYSHRRMRQEFRNHLAKHES